MTKIAADPLVALQGAMYAALTGDASLQGLVSGGLPIHDSVPDNAAFPYGVIGEDRAAPQDHDCQTATEVFSTVRIYSRGVGRVEVKRLAGRARFVLDKDFGFLVPGFVLHFGQCTEVDTHRHEDGLTSQAELSFRFLVSPE